MEIKFGSTLMPSTGLVKNCIYANQVYYEYYHVYESTSMCIMVNK